MLQRVARTLSGYGLHSSIVIWDCSLPEGLGLEAIIQVRRKIYGFQRLICTSRSCQNSPASKVADLSEYIIVKLAPPKSFLLCVGI